MKKIVALLLALALTLALAGCGPTDAEKLVGSWTGEMDMTETMNQMLAEDESLAEYGVTLDSFVLEVTMTFNEDGTFSLTVSEESVEKAVDGFLESMESTIVTMLEEEMAAAGLNMTVEEMLQISGMSMEDLMAEMRTEILGDETAAEAAAEMSSSGKYNAGDGKLFTSDDVEVAPGVLEYDLYTLEGDTLTLTEHVGGEAEDEEMTVLVYPIVLYRAA